MSQAAPLAAVFPRRLPLSRLVVAGCSPSGPPANGCAPSSTCSPPPWPARASAGRGGSV